MAALPGFWTEMVPPHMHIHVQPSVRAGALSTFICEVPGAQGAETDGTHGIGVNVPIAADVA